MIKRYALSSALILCLGIGSPAPASMATFEPSIAGATMSCLSWTGKPVRVVSNPQLDTLGRAFHDRQGAPVIEINFGALQSFSPLVQKWWFAHECAHLQLTPQMNSEKRADCLAAKRLRKFAGSDVVATASVIRRELSPLTGSDSGHLRGPERANLVLKCAGLTGQALA